MPVLEDDSLNWQAYLRQPFFVPESKKIGYLLNEFREKRIHLAIVVDEFGGTAGMVTLQDVLDEIFGEIREETAKEAQLIQPISETEFLVMAKTPLLELCRTLGLEETMFEEVKGEHDTVGGLLLEMLGKFPKAGEEISFAHLRFMVLAVTARKILQVRLTVLPPKVDED
jgi:CBS domain containing-hemolysin-like protein